MLAKHNPHVQNPIGWNGKLKTPISQSIFNKFFPYIRVFKTSYYALLAKQKFEPFPLLKHDGLPCSLVLNLSFVLAD